MYDNNNMMHTVIHVRHGIIYYDITSLTCCVQRGNCQFQTKYQDFFNPSDNCL